MRIAILCSGRLQARPPRTVPDLESSVAHFCALRSALIASVRTEEVTFFFSLNEGADDEEYVSKFCTALQIPDACVRVSSVTVPEEVYRVEKAHETSIPNSWSMFVHNQRAFGLMEDRERDRGTTFDLVLKYRADILPLNFGSLYDLPLRSALNGKSIYIPSGNDWRNGINDQVALGSRAVMKLYCDCVDRILDLCAQGTTYHPETLLSAHLHSIPELKIERFEFRYLL